MVCVNDGWLRNVNELISGSRFRKRYEEVSGRDIRRTGGEEREWD